MTLDALMARQKELAERQALNQQQGATTIPGGLAQMSNALFTGLAQRKAQTQEAESRQALAQLLSGISPETGATPEQWGQAYSIDPQLGATLMTGAQQARQAARQAELQAANRVEDRNWRVEDREDIQAAAAEGRAIWDDIPAPEGSKPGQLYQRNRTTGETKVVGGGGVNVQVGPGGEKLSEGQSRDLSLYSRAGNAEVDLGDLEKELTSAGGRAASLFGIAGQWWKDPKYKQAERAGKEVLAVILRKDSGGAITPEEMDQYAAIYLPMPGDDAQTIADKRRSREVAIRSLGYSVEGAAPEMYKRAQTDIEAYRAVKQQARGGQPVVPPPEAVPGETPAVPPPAAESTTVYSDEDVAATMAATGWTREQVLAEFNKRGYVRGGP